jgi:hypothetical protein
MDTVQNPAVEKLYRKFAALRATLPTDEREIFDQVIPAEEEVTAHRLARRSVRKAVKNTSEVAAHKLARKVSRKAAKNAPEVAAHKLTKQTTRKAARKSVKKAAR